MFTGIIQAVGRVQSVDRMGEGLAIAIDLGDLNIEKISPGDSIAVNGACLTVTELDRGSARFDVSGETLSKCLFSSWAKGDTVNLETARTLETPIGGHLVSGHVDGIAELVAVNPGPEFTAAEFETDRRIGKFIATKGSIALDGVSLTTNSVSDHADRTRFGVTLVPHTLQQTSLSKLQINQQVHVEVDQLARYIHRMQDERQQ